MSASTQPARRGFLALLAGAAAAPAAAALPAIAATTAPAEPVITEAPEVLALGERLASAIDAFKSAIAAKAEASAVYEQTKPARPAELIADRNDRMDQLSDHLLDAKHNLIRGETGEPLEMLCSRRIRAHLIIREIDGRTKEGRRLHRLARLARKYERDRDAALLASGYEEREIEASTAAGVVMGLARELAKLDPSTIDGATVFARLVMVYDEASEHAGYRCADTLTGNINRRLAGALLRIEGRA